MDSIVNLIRGVTRIRVSGASPEKYLNACAELGIWFSHVEIEDEFTLTMTVRTSRMKAALAAASKSMCSLDVVRDRGVPVAVKKLKKRYFLHIGAALCVAALAWSSLHIWQIDVVGNEAVSTAQILNALDKCGVSIGSFWPSFKSDLIRSEMVSRVEGLKWLTVNVSGSRAEVIVRERTEQPEMEEIYVPTNVVASKSGIIDDMYVLKGVALVGSGQTVLEGELLVTGEVGSNTGTRAVHAMANVTARTWYTLTAQAQSNVTEKAQTGQPRSKYALIFGTRRINFYVNSGICTDNCDKIINEYKLEIAGIFSLPVSLIKETYSEYETVDCPADEADKIESMKQLLMDQLSARLSDGGQVVSEEYSALNEDGRITVTLNAECLEKIGKLEYMTERQLFEIQMKNISNGGESSQ